MTKLSLYCKLFTHLYVRSIIMQRKHKPISFFRSLQQRQVYGNALSPYDEEGDKEAKRFINLLGNRREPISETDRIIYLSELKRLALLGSEPALHYFRNNLNARFTTFSTIDLNHSFRSITEEVAYYTCNPKLLVEAFYLFAFDVCETNQLSFVLPNVEKGFNCLITAANMQGKHATIASYILAYLYSSELGYHFNDTVPLNLTSITNLYNKLCTVLNRAIQENTPSNDINYNLILRKVILFFAELGCRQAIVYLMNSYKNGNTELKINKNSDQENKLGQRLDKLSDFLKEKYFEYFKIVLQNTKRYGHTTVSFPSVGFSYFVNVWGKIKYGEDYNKDTVDAIIKEDFIQDAMAGNLMASLSLGMLAFEDNNLNEAKIWFEKILACYRDVKVGKSNEVIIAARKMYEIAKNENSANQNQLLINAAELGCVTSLIQLGKIKLKANDFNEAKKYFDLAIEHSSSTSIPHQICNKLNHAFHLSQAVVSPYYFYLKGEEIKRGSLSAIDEMKSIATFTQDLELHNDWQEIKNAREMNPYAEVNAEIIDDLIKRTLENHARVYRYQIEQQAPRLTRRL